MSKYFKINSNFENKKIAIVANDAGGAQILSYLSLNLKNKIFYVLSGPAKKIFFKRNNVKKNYKISNVIKKIDLIITGTSFSSNLETDSILLAKKYKKKVYSFIDHWCNYKIRFLRNGKLILPDAILTGDKDSYLLAKKTFKKTQIKFISNPHFLHIKKFKKIKKKNISTNILFVSDNMNRVTSTKNTDELILKKVINFYKKKILNNKIQLIVRNHPSEQKNKYKNIIKNMKIKIDNNSELTSSLMNVNTILGHQSMAMVIGKLFGIKTIYVKFKKLPNQIPMRYIDKII